MHFHSRLSSGLVVLSSVFAIAGPPASSAPEGGAASAKATLRSESQAVGFGMEIVSALERATDVGPADPELRLSLCVSIPYAHPEALQEFADAVSNPSSPTYRNFITPEQVGERFGMSIDKVNEIADYLVSNGFEITMISKNHTTIQAFATVATPPKCSSRRTSRPT